MNTNTHPNAPTSNVDMHTTPQQSINTLQEAMSDLRDLVTTRSVARDPDQSPQFLPMKSLDIAINKLSSIMTDATLPDTDLTPTKTLLSEALRLVIRDAIDDTCFLRIVTRRGLRGWNSSKRDIPSQGSCRLDNAVLSDELRETVLKVDEQMGSAINTILDIACWSDPNTLNTQDTEISEQPTTVKTQILPDDTKEQRMLKSRYQVIDAIDFLVDAFNACSQSARTRTLEHWQDPAKYTKADLRTRVVQLSEMRPDPALSKSRSVDRRGGQHC